MWSISWPFGFVLEAFAGTSCATLRSAARNLSLNFFFANTRNMAYNKQSPWSAVSLQQFCLVFFVVQTREL